MNIESQCESIPVPRSASRNVVDLNGLLGAANLLVAALLASVYARADGNPFVDPDSVLLGILLCVQTQIALLFERRRRDPFVILLAFEMIFYYSLRIFTLTLYPYSDVFERFPYAPGDSNYALIFILSANVCLYAALFLVKPRDDQTIAAGTWRPTAPRRVIALMIFAITFTYFSGSLWTEDTMPRALNVIGQFLGANIVILMTLSFYFLFRRSLSRKFAVIIGILVILDLVAHTLAGSRSTIVIVVQQCLLVGLALQGRIQLQRNHAVLGAFLFPAFVALLVASFTISTINRSNKESNTYLDVGQAARLASESSSNLALGPDLDVVLPPIFSRAGFFDFAAELIAHRARYSSVINPSAYIESIVDNLLTPGFDVFDAPRISNALIFVYQEAGAPSKMRVLDAYQSDQMDIYGEFYCLLGYASLPLFFVVAYLFKRLYVGVRTGGPFRRAVTKVIILLLFVNLLRSFGVDWVIIEAVPLIAATYMYAFIFASRSVPAVPAASPT